MKYTILIVVFLISAKAAFTQPRRPEYSRYTNGLLYEDTMLSRLKRIANDRNTRYKEGLQNRTCYSVPQALGRYVSLKSDKAKEAIADIHNNISLEDFVKKYPQTIIRDSNVLIVLHKRNYEGKKEFRYTLYPDSIIEDGYRYIGFDSDSADVMQKTSSGDIRCRTGNWVFSYWKADDNREVLSALYLNTPLKSVALPERYSAWVRYADCLIDTTSIFFPTAKDGFRYWYDGNKYGPKYEALRKNINEDTGYSNILSYIGKQLKKQPAYKKVFTEAVKEALQLQYPTSFWFETAVEMYYSKPAALTLKRNRHLYVRCGNDRSDWLHMFDIAHLAAETANWPVFINAHLDLMQRRPLGYGASIGINLKSERRAFIQELEMLDLNVHDLFMGICLKVSDATTYHFSTRFQYICRYLREARCRNMFEQDVLSMMADNELDDYNRLRLHYLFLNYLHFVRDNDLKPMFDKLVDADKKMPYYMHSALKASMKGPLELIEPD